MLYITARTACFLAAIGAALVEGTQTAAETKPDDGRDPAHCAAGGGVPQFSLRGEKLRTRLYEGLQYFLGSDVRRGQQLLPAGDAEKRETVAHLVRRNNVRAERSENRALAGVNCSPGKHRLCVHAITRSFVATITHGSVVQFPPVSSSVLNK
jgi:hypothetical protein